MATYTTFIDGFQSKKRISPVVDRVRVNFSAQALDASSGDVHQILNIPAGATVLRVWMRVVTAAPTGATCKIGYGSVPGRWGERLKLDATGIIDLKLVTSASTGREVLFDDKSPMAAPVYFAAADTLDLTATVDGTDTNLSSGVVDVYVEWFKE